MQRSYVASATAVSPRYNVTHHTIPSMLWLGQAPGARVSVTAAHIATYRLINIASLDPKSACSVALCIRRHTRHGSKAASTPHTSAPWSQSPSN